MNRGASDEATGLVIDGPPRSSRTPAHRSGPATPIGDGVHNLVLMSLARLDWSASVRSRIVWSFLLCAVALGLVGMHGLSHGGASLQPAGHHVVQAVDVALATPDVAVSDDAPPSEDAGPLALCLMMLVPAVAVGLWLHVGPRVSGWLPRRGLRLAMRTSELAQSVQPVWRQLSVLRI